MISAFGVVHKSYNRLQPKLYGSIGERIPQATDTMEQRMKYNYVVSRGIAGNNGKYSRGKPSQGTIDVARHYKKFAAASAEGAKNARRGRKRRVLP